MLANVLITQVHSHSCTFFSHVPCYVREHTVEEHHRTHSLTYVPAPAPTHEKKNKKRKQKRKQKSIDSRLYSWRQNRTFVHTNEFPTFYPHSHILSTKFPTFLGQLSTFFRHFSTRFPHFLASFPHFSGVSHILQTFTYVHIFIKSQTFVYTKVGFFQNVKYKKIELKNTKKGLLSPIFKIFFYC